MCNPSHPKLLSPTSGSWLHLSQNSTTGRTLFEIQALMLLALLKGPSCMKAEYPVGYFYSNLGWLGLHLCIICIIKTQVLATGWAICITQSKSHSQRTDSICSRHWKKSIFNEVLPCVPPSAYSLLSIILVMPGSAANIRWEDQKEECCCKAAQFPSTMKDDVIFSFF